MTVRGEKSMFHEVHISSLPAPPPLHYYYNIIHYSMRAKHVSHLWPGSASLLLQFIHPPRTIDTHGTPLPWIATTISRKTLTCPKLIGAVGGNAFTYTFGLIEEAVGTGDNVADVGLAAYYRKDGRRGYGDGYGNDCRRGYRRATTTTTTIEFHLVFVLTTGLSMSVVLSLEVVSNG